MHRFYVKIIQWSLGRIKKLIDYNFSKKKTLRTDTTKGTVMEDFKN